MDSNAKLQRHEESYLLQSTSNTIYVILVITLFFVSLHLCVLNPILEVAKNATESLFSLARLSSVFSLVSVVKKKLGLILKLFLSGKQVTEGIRFFDHNTG